MAFIHEPIVEKSFNDIEEIIAWAEEEQKNLIRVPIHGVLKHGGQFLDDEYFGDDQTVFQFNQSGIRSLCSIIGIRLSTLELLERQNLATDVLNDLLDQQAIQDKLKTLEFILDESRNIILGIVSNSYVGYSNFQLLQDIEKLIKPMGQQPSLFSQEEDFVFKGA